MENDNKDKNTWIEDVAADGVTDVMATYRAYDAEFARTIEHGLLRKIDRRILPLVLLIYLFNYLDRNSITQARVYGLQEDTHLKGAEYQTVISIFSVGYILMQIPSTMLMTKFRPSVYLVCIRAHAVKYIICRTTKKITATMHDSLGLG